MRAWSALRSGIARDLRLCRHRSRPLFDPCRDLCSSNPLLHIRHRLWRGIGVRGGPIALVGRGILLDGNSRFDGLHQRRRHFRECIRTFGRQNPTIPRRTCITCLLHRCLALCIYRLGSINEGTDAPIKDGPTDGRFAAFRTGELYHDRGQWDNFARCNDCFGGNLGRRQTHPRYGDTDRDGGCGGRQTDTQLVGCRATRLEHPSSRLTKLVYIEVERLDRIIKRFAECLYMPPGSGVLLADSADPCDHAPERAHHSNHHDEINHAQFVLERIEQSKRRQDENRPGAQDQRAY